MKKIVLTPGFLLFTVVLFSQPVIEINYLVFRSEKRAERINEKLFQVGVDTEIQIGYSGKRKVYVMEIQDLSILDIEIQRDNEWRRYFPERIVNRHLITVYLIF